MSRVQVLILTDNLNEEFFKFFDTDLFLRYYEVTIPDLSGDLNEIKNICYDIILFIDACNPEQTVIQKINSYCEINKVIKSTIHFRLIKSEFKENTVFNLSVNVYTKKIKEITKEGLFQILGDIIQKKHNSLERKKNEEYEKYSLLPMAVYISAPDGIILDFNQEASKLLHLIEDDKLRKNILDLYVNQNDRIEVIKNLMCLENGNWIKNETLQFKLKTGERKSLRYFAKPYFKTVSKKKVWIGSISLVFEITNLERFRKLEDLLSLSLFEVDQNNILSYYNKSFAKQVGIKLPHDEPINVTDFFTDINEFNLLISKIKNNNGGVLTEEIVRLKKFDNKNQLLIAELDLLPKVEKDNNNIQIISKVKGVLRNVSINNINNAPLGLYVVIVDPVSGERKIGWANKKFEEIHGFSSESEYIGKAISSFHKTQESFTEFERKLYEEEEKGKDITDYVIEIVNERGEEKELIVNARVLKNAAGSIIGRVGSVFDVSETVKRQLFKEVENDYGAFLHTYKALLHDVESTLISIIDAHGTDHVKNSDININRTFKTIIGCLKNLSISLDGYFDLCRERNLVTESFEYDIRRILTGLVIDLSEKQEFNSEALIRSQISKIRDKTKEIRDRIAKHKAISLLPSSIWKKIQNDISEVLRFARLVSISQLIRQTKDMNLEVETLSRAISPDIEEKIKLETIQLISPLNKAIVELTEFANSEKISVNLKYNPIVESAYLNANHRNLYIIFYNLIHNAIKYSWKKNQELNAEVRISVDLKNNHKDGLLKRIAYIIIENYGVPIHKSELEENKIYKFGYRGVFSKDRDRKGTGVGLWHVRKLLKEIDGEIFMTSIPINHTHDYNYQKPFITTVKIVLNIENL